MKRVWGMYEKHLSDIPPITIYLWKVSISGLHAFFSAFLSVNKILLIVGRIVG
jgi:hypothetical protein